MLVPHERVRKGTLACTRARARSRFKLNKKKRVESTFINWIAIIAAKDFYCCAILLGGEKWGENTKTWMAMIE